MSVGWVRRIWERRGIGGKTLWLCFLPLAALYRSAIQLRNLSFRLGWLRRARLPRPVISVGNLTVGGTGKTPACLWLAGELRERGLRVAILSRGYGRKQKHPMVLSPAAVARGALEAVEASEAGDEPLMMARLYGQTVGVSADRSAAAAALLAVADLDVFILDDGYQHRRVKRDVDLLLLGAAHSGSVLPAGPFREPRKNLQRADFLLATAAEDRWQKIVPPNRSAHLFAGTLRPVALLGLTAGQVQEFPLTLLYRSKVLTVTGIADPRGLYRLIHEWDGEIINALEYEDHHVYSNGDWQEINRSARSADLIITTEKDILKLQRFPFAKDKLLALRVAMSVTGGDALIGAIIEKIQNARQP